MSKWQILLIKELRHLFRDTKTIIQTVVVPTFITPLLIGGIFYYIGSLAVEEGKKTYDLGFIGETNNALFISMEESERLNLIGYESVDELMNAVSEDSVDIGVDLNMELTLEISNNKTADILIFFKDIDTFSQAKSLVVRKINDFNDLKRNERLVNFGINPEELEPINLIEEDLTTEREFAGSIIGAFVALIFVAYLMQGTSTPALDLGAGEKERGTMETLASTNISSIDIIVGKMLAITSSAVITATFSLLGFVLPLIIIFLFFQNSIPDGAFTVVSSIINPLAILGIFLLAIPLSILMGAFMLAISIYSKSTKEAGLLLGNVLLIFIVPVYVPLINPGMELDFIGSLIPCFNLALHTNALIAGNVDWLLFGSSFLSTVIYCLIAVYITYIMFDDERIIFRS